MAENESPRRWYVMLTNTDGGVVGLIGPIKGDEANAEAVADLLLERDRQLADAVDWDDAAVCAPYWFTGVLVVDLNPTEVRDLDRTVGQRRGER